MSNFATILALPSEAISGNESNLMLRINGSPLLTKQNSINGANLTSLTVC